MKKVISSNSFKLYVFCMIFACLFLSFIAQAYTDIENSVDSLNLNDDQKSDMIEYARENQGKRSDDDILQEASDELGLSTEYNN